MSPKPKPAPHREAPCTPAGAWPGAPGEQLARLRYKARELSPDRATPGALGTQRRDTRCGGDFRGRARSNQTNTHAQYPGWARRKGPSADPGAGGSDARPSRRRRRGRRGSAPYWGPGEDGGVASGTARGEAGPERTGRGLGAPGAGPGLLAAGGGLSRRAGAGAEASEVPCGRAAGLEPAAPRYQLARRRLSGLWSSRCLCSEHRRSRRSLPPARRRSRAPSARAARMRLPGLGLGLGLEREEAEQRRRRAACDGELLLDAVLRAPPQGSGAAAARRRVSPGGSRRCARGPAAGGGLAASGGRWSRRPASGGFQGNGWWARARGQPRGQGLPRVGDGTGSTATRARPRGARG